MTPADKAKQEEADKAKTNEKNAGFPPNIPAGEADKGVAGSALPPAEDFTEGEYQNGGMYAGETFALSIVEDDRLGRTHKCLNTTHYWEGDEAAFRKEFLTKDGKRIGDIKPSKSKAKAKDDK